MELYQKLIVSIKIETSSKSYINDINFFLLIETANPHHIMY